MVDFIYEKPWHIFLIINITKNNVLKKITNVAYIINEWRCGVCVVSSIVININCSNIKYCGIIHLLMQPKRDIKSACKLLLPPTRRPLNSINLVLHSVNNAYHRLQLLKFTFTLESRAKPRLAPNSQRTTANFTFLPAQVSSYWLRRLTFSILYFIKAIIYK